MFLSSVRQIPVINLASCCLKLRSLFSHSDCECQIPKCAETSLRNRIPSQQDIVR